MGYECKLEHQTVQPTLSLRFRAPRESLTLEFRRAYATLGSYLGETGARRAGPAFATFHGMDDSGLEVEAGFVVCEATAGQGEILSGKLAEGEVATAIHTGPYENLSYAYSALINWAHGHGLTSAGPVSEFYLDDPVMTPFRHQRTKIALPVEPA